MYSRIIPATDIFNIWNAAAFPECNYILKQNDYSCVVLDQSHSYGICEILGKTRPAQEDFLVCSSTLPEDLITLNAANKTEVLKSTFEQLQQEHGQSYAVGSTGCAAFAWRENNTVKTLVANVGDSTAFLVIINPTNPAIVDIHALNTLHNSYSDENLAESTRIRETSEKYQKPLQRKEHGRVGPRKINLSRAFGDLDSERYGLLHEPEITDKEFTLQENEIAFLIVACDGLTESCPLKAMNDIILHYYAKPVSEFATGLVKKAFSTGSEDNISVAVVKLDATLASIAVFDGHGGKSISSALSAAFYISLQKQITYYQFLQKMNLSKEDNDRAYEMELRCQLNKNIEKVQHALDQANVLFDQAMLPEAIQEYKNANGLTSIALARLKLNFTHFENLLALNKDYLLNTPIKKTLQILTENKTALKNLEVLIKKQLRDAEQSISPRSRLSFFGFSSPQLSPIKPPLASKLRYSPSL